MDKKKYVLFGVVFGLALGLDQWTKHWARTSLDPLHHAIVVIQGYFDLRYSENTGSAFGLFRGLSYARPLLLGIGVVALGVIGVYLKRVRPDRIRIAAWLGLLAGGAVGNIVDRLIYEKVTDFIVWKVGSHEWPTFNIADAALVVGLALLLIDARAEDTAPPESPSIRQQPAAKPQKSR
jgi:signal peptidase II